MWLSGWGFPEPGLGWLLPTRNVSCGIWDCPRTISGAYINSPNVLGDGEAPVVSVCSFTTAAACNAIIPYLISLSPKLSAASLHPSCVSWASLICFSQKVCMRCFTVLEIVAITQRGSSSSLSLPSSVSSSSSSSFFLFSSSSELARLLRPSPTVFSISSHGVSDIVVVDRAFSTFLICSSSCILAISASWTHFFATTVSLSTESSIHFTFSLLHKQFVFHLFSAERFFLDCELCNGPNTPSDSASKLLLPLFAWRRRLVDFLVNLLYLPTGSGHSALLENWPLYLVLTLLLGEMLDVARYGPPGGKLGLVCQGC